MGIEEHLTIGTLAVISALMINLGGLVWGAAKVAASINRIEDDVIPTLMSNLTKLTELVQSHDRDIAVLKALGRRSTDWSYKSHREDDDE